MSYLKDQKAKQLSETIDKLKKSHLVDKIYPQNVFGKTKTENFKKSKDSDFRRPNQGNHIPSDPFIEEIDEDYPQKRASDPIDSSHITQTKKTNKKRRKQKLSAERSPQRSPTKPKPLNIADFDQTNLLNETDQNLWVEKYGFERLHDFNMNTDSTHIKEIENRFNAKSHNYNREFNETHFELKDWLKNGYKQKYTIDRQQIGESIKKNIIGGSSAYRLARRTSMMSTNSIVTIQDDDENYQYDSDELDTRWDKNFNFDELNKINKNEEDKVRQEYIAKKLKEEDEHRSYKIDKIQEDDEEGEDCLELLKSMKDLTKANYNKEKFGNYKLTIKNSNLKTDQTLSNDREDINCYQDLGNIAYCLYSKDVENFDLNDWDLIEQDFMNMVDKNFINQKDHNGDILTIGKHYWRLCDMANVIKNIYQDVDTSKKRQSYVDNCQLPVSSMMPLSNFNQIKQKMVSGLLDDSSVPIHDKMSQKLSNMHISNDSVAFEDKSTINFKNCVTKYQTTNTPIKCLVDNSTQCNLVKEFAKVEITEDQVAQAINDFFKNYEDLSKRLKNTKDFGYNKELYQCYKETVWELLDKIIHYRFRDFDKKEVCFTVNQMLNFTVKNIPQFKGYYVRNFYLPEILYVIIKEIKFFSNDKHTPKHDIIEERKEVKKQPDRTSYFEDVDSMLNDILQKVEMSKDSMIYDKKMKNSVSKENKQPNSVSRNVSKELINVIKPSLVHNKNSAASVPKKNSLIPSLSLYCDKDQENHVSHKGMINNGLNKIPVNGSSVEQITFRDMPRSFTVVDESFPKKGISKQVTIETTSDIDMKKLNSIMMEYDNIIGKDAPQFGAHKTRK